MLDSEASYGRVRTRVVGFKILDSSVSPTSVVSTDVVSSQLTMDDSPRSLIAVALKADNFRPLPRLTIKTTPKHGNLAALKRCKSHADLREGSEPATPASFRSSTSSTPMTIPSK